MITRRAVFRLRAGASAALTRIVEDQFLASSRAPGATPRSRPQDLSIPEAASNSDRNTQVSQASVNNVGGDV